MINLNNFILLVLLIVFLGFSAFSTQASEPAYQSSRRQIHRKYVPLNKEVKVAFFDADSTLRVAPSGNVSANGKDDVLLLPGVARGIKALVNKGYFIAIVSNQGGVPRNVPEEVADGALQTTIRLIEEGGGTVHYYDYATSEEEFDRKPNVGMFARLKALLEKTYSPNAPLLTQSWFMVGDSAFKGLVKGNLVPDYTAKCVREADGTLHSQVGTHFSNADRLFAQNAGIAFVEPTDLFGWRKFGIDVFEKKEQVDAFMVEHPKFGR